MRVPNLEGKLAQLDPTTCLIFIDVKKAHFWSPACRRLLVELPSGMGYPPGKVGLLRKSLYGTRDAPANWEAAIKAVMMLIGFQQSQKQLMFVLPRREANSHRGARWWFHRSRTKSRVGMVCRRTSQTLDDWCSRYFGTPIYEGCGSFNCYLESFGDVGRQGHIEMEADPRHVDLLLQEVDCEGAKVTTPLIKERIEETLTSEELDEETSAMYRSASMRLAYLSQDRPDLLVLGKEL